MFDSLFIYRYILQVVALRDINSDYNNRFKNNLFFRLTSVIDFVYTSASKIWLNVVLSLLRIDK